MYIRASAQVVLEDEIEHARAVYNAFAKTFALTPENTTGDSVMKLYKATPEKIWVNAEGSRDGQYIDVRREVVCAKKDEYELTGRTR